MIAPTYPRHTQNNLIKQNGVFFLILLDLISAQQMFPEISDREFLYFEIYSILSVDSGKYSLNENRSL